MEKLRIMHVGPTQWPGGVTSSITALSIDMARLGHEVMLVGDGHDQLAELQSSGVTYETVTFSPNVGELARSVRTVRSLLQRFRPDIVHVHGRSPALLMHLARRRPDWFTLHNSFLTDQVGKLDRGITRRYLSPLGRSCFALNEEAVTYLQSELGVAADRIRLITNGVDCEHFRPPSAIERQRARAAFGAMRQQTLAVFVGRLHEQKDPLAVVELAAAAREAGSDHVKFAMVGDGPLADEVRTRIEDLDLGDRCAAPGWGDAREAYHAADVVLMPSLYEGFGLVGVEAMACGTPVLRTASGGYESVLQAETGWVCPIDRDAFVAMGIDVLRDPAHLAEMRAKTRAHTVATLSIRRQVELTIEAYESTRRDSDRAEVTR